MSLRLDPDVPQKFRATGKGWRSRIDEVPRNARIRRAVSSVRRIGSTDFAGLGRMPGALPDTLEAIAAPPIYPNFATPA